MKRIVVPFCLSLLVALAQASTWSESFSFRPGGIDITPSVQNGQVFHQLRVGHDFAPDKPGLHIGYETEPGKPFLPNWSFTLVIPQGMRVASVVATPTRTELLPGSCNLMPTQPPVPFSVRNRQLFVPPDPTVYSQDTPYPGAFAETGRVGVKSGFRLVTVTLYPVRYRPLSGRVEVATRLTVKVRYEPDPAARPAALTEEQLRAFGASVRALVFNPADVTRYAPSRRSTDFGNIDCIVITSDGLQSDFQSLVDWHTQKGYKTEVRTTTWITSNYTGRDTQERIRNFIIDYYNTQGLMWVILGGDNGVVPCRRARAYVNNDTGDIPCDLYYADLQGSWDDDNDNIFGEPGDDNVDLYYDLFVGRASVDTATQVQTFVNKVLTHEKNPPTAYLRRMLLADAPLWPLYNHHQTNDSIAAITPAGWQDVILQNVNNTTAIRDSLDNGFQFCHIVAHGSEAAVWNGGTQIYNTARANSQTNGDRANLLNSIACLPGNFEYSDCLAEAAHNRNGGGSVAVIMNSRYGWGPGNVNAPPGTSEKFDIRFYDYFFNHDTLPIGLTHASSKEVYRNNALMGGSWRWCYYELNLFGDPLLMMYEDVPTPLQAAYPDPIGTGSQSFTVTVTASGSPVTGALVCVAKGTEIYDRGFANASGQITFTINPTTTGYMDVTATAAKHLPFEDSCQVTAPVRDVGCYRIVSPGALVNSGTLVTPRAMVRNYTGFAVANVPVKFDIGAVYSDTQTIPTLGPNDSALVSFAVWPAVPGSYALKCSTMVAGDANPGNDFTAGNTFVQQRDVGTVTVSAPAQVDSGDVVLPVATVQNFGNTTETFDVRLDISGTGYSHTRTKTLTPGASDTTNFPAWNALERGTHTLACSTRLAGDMNTGNDKATTSVFVRVQDVSCNSIVAPVGMIDSTATHAVQARLQNRGNVPETFTAEFRVAGPANWSDVATVSNLNPGEIRDFSFADWPVGPPGNYSTTCTTRLTGDRVVDNNRATGSFTVRAFDAAAIAILSPGSQVDTNSTVPVRVVVANLGSAVDNIFVSVAIGWQYWDSTTVALPAGATDTLTFTDWSVHMGRGQWLVTCSTYTAGDVDPSNNVIHDSVLVVVHDVSVTEIVAPSGTVDSGTTVIPRARLFNFGSVPETFGVDFTITDGYSSSLTVTLNPSDDSTLAFPTWTANTPGSFVTRCSTKLAGDDYPTNDFKTGTVTVAATDVGVVAILAPAGNIDPGPVTPSAQVANYSPSARSFTTYFTILAGDSTCYFDSTAVTNLPPDSVQDVSFSSWDAVPGSYIARCSTYVPGDQQPLNDTASVEFCVYTRDVGVSAIVAPVGTMRPFTVSPVVKVTNYGDATENCWAFLVIQDTVSGSVAYLDSVFATGIIPGRTVNQTLPPWFAPLGYYRLTSYTRMPGDANPANDTSRANLKVTPGPLGWQIRANIPLGVTPVRHGGCMAGMLTDSLRLYALKGYKTCEFYVYNAGIDYWRAVAPIPLGPEEKAVKKGASICSDGGRYLYAVKGNKTLEFWRYDTNNDIWEPLPDVPAGAEQLKEGSDLAFVRYGASSCVYLLKASKTYEFYAYSVEGDSWLVKKSAPPGPSGKVFKKGAALCAVGNHLLAIKGRYNEFFAYNIATDEWTTRNPMPEYGTSGSKLKRCKTKDGCDLTYDGHGNVYAWPGGNRNFFFVYVDSTDCWVELESLPREPSGRRVKYGGSLYALGKQIWALKGNKTYEFWVYTPDTMLVYRNRPARGGIAGAGTGLPDPVLSVSPNPAHQHAVVAAPGATEPCQVQLISPLGQVIAERGLLPDRTVRLDLRALPAGTYFVRVKNRQQTETVKLVIRN